ncbi:hypothetical protein CcCBS67573_g07056 [Chytriomyces confervae]|uniref:Uncharacterized protein n=1 Tax=Chytriomyces confervae TaxID=246404 RepID=A0A507EZF6_9FUNG|nr:hypothetical protein HDU80_008382 [Chytriomyces hyalinus]TPX68805.1 hypothetical protein CcCBS67573_g07056 [Chytriomyces confervae]
MHFSKILAVILVPLVALSSPVRELSEPQVATTTNNFKANNLSPDQAIKAVEEMMNQIGLKLIQNGPELITDLEQMVTGATSLAAGNPLGIASLAKGLAGAGKLILPVIIEAIDKAKEIGKSASKPSATSTTTTAHA